MVGSKAEKGGIAKDGMQMNGNTSEVDLIHWMK
jgi:hypothetical protein